MKERTYCHELAHISCVASKRTLAQTSNPLATPRNVRVLVDTIHVVTDITEMHLSVAHFVNHF